MAHALTAQSATSKHSYFCPCPRGLEAALAEEISEIAQLAAPAITLKVHNQVPGGVHCSGLLSDAWRINLHSRIASRVLMRLAHGFAVPLSYWVIDPIAPVGETMSRLLP